MQEECKRGNIFAKLICNVFEKCANYKIVCPFKEVNLIKDDLAKLYVVLLQGPYEYNELTLPQGEIPSFIPINDKFKLILTSKGKLKNKLYTLTQITVDWELKELD